VTVAILQQVVVEVSQPEACKIVGFTPFALERARKAGHVVSRRGNGKCWLYTLDSILAYRDKRNARLAARAAKRRQTGSQSQS
jgi:hypothetical protein